MQKMRLKLGLIQEVNPTCNAEFPADGFQVGISCGPRIGYNHIWKYLIEDVEFKKQLSVEKPIVKGYNFFKSGKVLGLYSKSENGLVYVKSQVQPSYSKGGSVYDVKIIIHANSEIQKAFCPCPAGNDGRCSHLAASLFAMKDIFNKTVNMKTDTDQLPCTSKPCTWNVPKKRKQEPSTIQGVNFQKHVLGQILFPFVFRFLTYLLSCILFFRSGILFITLPLSCAVCKFRYNLSPRPYFIASPFFFLHGAISVTTFVEVSSLFGGPDHQPYLPQHLVSSFVFIAFSFISFCSRLKVVFLYCNYYFFALCRNLLFLYGLRIVKHLLIVNVSCFGIGPCPFIFVWNWPLPVHFVNSKWWSKLWRILGQPRIPAQALGRKWRVHFKKKRCKKLYSVYESHWQDTFQQ